jgi:hypothetical protein
LNAFDNTGDSRATVIVFQTYGGNKRPDRPNGGFYVEETEQAKTLDSSNGLNPSASQGGIIIFTAQRVGEPPRIYENITPSLLSRMGTGGNNTPMVVVREELPIAFDSNASGAYTIHADGMSPPIKVGSGIDIPSPPAVAIPIQDGRDMEKHQNGLGVGNEGDPSYTLDQTGAQSVAVNFDELNNTGGDTVHHTLRNTGGVSSGVYHNTIVRRLTPLECERLMGWPDNHTLHRADGKTNSDSTRYKMCGNGVATPVAEWIATQLKGLL